MLDLHDIRYVRLGTNDLEMVTDYATKILGLQIERREKNAVYFRSDSREHTLCYFEGDPSDHTTAFEVDEKDKLETAASFLENNGYAVSAGSAQECEIRHSKDFIKFRDPTGNQIELVWRPQDMGGRRYFPSRDAGVTDFSHVGLCTTDCIRDGKFWTEMTNAKVSDWIGDAPLLRIDEIHHKIALFPTTHAGVQHINHQVESIDDIMRSFYFLQDKGIRIQFGPGRHPTSGAMFLYFEGPHGMVYEYSTGVSTITDEEAHEPRSFPFEPKGFCLWGSKPDIKEFKD